MRAAPRLAILAALSCASSSLAFAQQPSFAIPASGVSLITGDTWIQNGQRMRLYGVQSCIRGTLYTNAAGRKSDCGEASLAYLSAIMRDTHPQCTAIARIAGADSTILVVCQAYVGENTLDLGEILITQGYAFAAFTNAREPVYLPYFVAEGLARNHKAGLWSAHDLPHPNAVIFQSLKRP